MELRAASIEYLIRIIMEDLHQFIEGEESILDSKVYGTLESWMSYFEGEVQLEEYELIDNQIHDYLYEMSIWEYGIEFQTSVAKKIRLYFKLKYSEEPYVKLLADRIVNYYLVEIQKEFSDSLRSSIIQDFN
ncbi:hypothetical protein ACFQZE_06915 [Paenibacillus sp. GCM10027627]|uniref:hypothetical protein n=1 Tax=unclassified Paenibacillus TaxID=185978 RepID=UPI00363BE733